MLVCVHLRDDLVFSGPASPSLNLETKDVPALSSVSSQVQLVVNQTLYLDEAKRYSGVLIERYKMFLSTAQRFASPILGKRILDIQDRVSLWQKKTLVSSAKDSLTFYNPVLFASPTHRRVYWPPL